MILLILTSANKARKFLQHIDSQLLLSPKNVINEFCRINDIFYSMKCNFILKSREV